MIFISRKHWLHTYCVWNSIPGNEWEKKRAQLIIRVVIENHLMCMHFMIKYNKLLNLHVQQQPGLCIQLSYLVENSEQGIFLFSTQQNQTHDSRYISKFPSNLAGGPSTNVYYSALCTHFIIMKAKVFITFYCIPKWQEIENTKSSTTHERCVCHCYLFETLSKKYIFHCDMIF